MSEVLKWWQTVQVSWTNHLAYKLNFFLIMIGPSLVFFFVKYNLWSSIYEVQGGGEIRGYDFQGMLSYQIWVLIVSLMAQGHSGMNLAEDIRLGRISAYLIYPFQFWQFHTANFLGFQVIQVFVSISTLAIVFSTGLLPDLNLAFVLKGFLYCALVSLVWFVLQYIAGLLAFWLEETWMIRVLMATSISFLSGSIIPLEIFPDSFANFLTYTPFPYMTYVPAKILMGQYDGSVLTAVFILASWLILLVLTAWTIWRKGLKLYTAAGM